MRTFLLKLGIVFVVFCGLLVALQYVVDHGLQETDDPIFNDWNWVLHGKINSQMVFLGNSRTEAHFDPKIIEEKTGVSCYNLGLAGASLSIGQLRWKSYLAHNEPPKIVVQNIDLYALTNKEIPDKKQFLPYYNEPEIIDRLEKLDHSVRIEKVVPMSKYRGYELQILKGLGFPIQELGMKKKFKGYNCHPSKWNDDFKKQKESLHGKKITYSEKEIRKEYAELQALISDCKTINATLILVWAPQYIELNKLQEPTLSRMRRAMKQIALNNKKVLFWDFTNESLTHDTNYFYNAFHMNTKGVAVFCNHFSDSLNTYFKEPIP